MHLRLGTRASALAQWQATWVAEQLRAIGHDVELVFITTQGDTSQGDPSQSAAVPVASMGGVGVFTKELQRALLDGRIDLAVHSLKDLPTDPVEGLTLAAVPERESPFDVLISREGHQLDELPQGATIGTGSLRRRAQLLYHRPDLQMYEIRGNVDTRLHKLRDGQFDAIVLAEAGLKRLGLADQITQILPAKIMLPAVGQGALGIETRTGDTGTIAAVTQLDHAACHSAILAERELLAQLAGGCLAPIGAHATLDAIGSLVLNAVVASPDGRHRLTASDRASRYEWKELGQSVARQLRKLGADALIQGARTVG